MGTVQQDILFKIGTTGAKEAGRNIKEFGMKLGAAVAVAGVFLKVLKDTVDSAQKFGKIFRANSTDISLFNRDTAGLIDTTVALTKAVEFQEAGLRLNAEQMRAVGVAAADFAQKTGKDVNATFSALTKSIITARETGLLQFGITLSQTADKAAASEEALQKLIDKTRGLKLETQTVDEAFKRFNNTLGTIKDLEVDAFLNAAGRAFSNLGTEILGGIESLEEYEGQIHATNGAILDWKWTTEGLQNTLLRNAETIADVIKPGLGDLIDMQWLLGDAIDGANTEYQQQIILMTKQANLIRELEGQRASERKRIQSEADYSQWVDEYSAANSKLIKSIGSGSREDQLRAKSEFYKVLGQQPEVPAAFAAAGAHSVVPELEREFFEPRIKGKPRGGGKGGRGRSKDSDFMITEEEAAAAELAEQLLALSTQRVIGEGEVAGRGQFNTVGPQGRAAGAGAGRAQALAIGKEETPLERELREFEENEAKKAEVAEFWGQQQVAIEDRTIQQKITLYENSGKMTQQILGDLSAAQDKTSRDGFNRAKAMDYGQNVMQTALGATSAFTSGLKSGIPFPGNVIAGTAAAAAVTAKGFARGRTIRGQKYNSISSGGSDGGGFSIPTGGGGGSDGGNRSYTFNVQLSGQTLHQSIINENDMANQSGNKSFATVGS